MKKKSKIKSGFTLLETVISMMIIAIVSVGVYQAYIMLIRNTKDGEVRQEATLIGKKVVEEIKSQNKNIDEIRSTNLDKDGNPTDDNSKICYKVDVKKSGKGIKISNGYDGKKFFISNDKISKDKINMESNNIEETKEILVDINNKEIKFKDGTCPNDIQDIENIALDFSYFSNNSKAIVEVENDSDKQVTLYILNSSGNDSKTSNVEIKKGGTSGDLNKCYQNTDGNDGRSGELTEIEISISGKSARGAFEDDIFKTKIYSNID